MAGLSKSRIMLHRQCPKRLWLAINHPELAEEDAGLATRLSAGNDVGAVARGLFPGGILIDTLDGRQALAETAAALAGPPIPIFEAAFACDGVLVRADLLLPAPEGYRMVEVKSSTTVKEYHYADAAIQNWVASQAGLKLSRIELAHINNQFVYPGAGKYQGLFTFADISSAVRELSQEVPGWMRSVRNTLAGAEPDLAPGEQCHDPFTCPFLGYCAPQKSDGFPPEILPYRDGKALAAELRAAGFDDLAKTPEGWFIGSKHHRIWRATTSGAAIVEPEAGAAIAALAYPRYYLDFETIGFAVPIWAGTRPYRQLPFQWSCHIERENGDTEHREFLATGPEDPRRAFVENLLPALAASGPVLVYNAGFESGRLRELAGDFPDLAAAIEELRGRIVDLLPLTRKYYYHPEMRGSWSIKAVLPTIAPELAYDGLTVADGGMAQEAFLEILNPQTSATRVDELRQALLLYCERDTWAMVRIARFFQGW